MNEKFILDATAGFRMMWFNKHHPNAIYLDQRPECEPDVIGDFRELSNFTNESFKLIVFDPPHIVKNEIVNNQNTLRVFGQLQPETWQSDLKRAFAECWRCLAPYGVLLFKWNNCSVSSPEVLKLIPEQPLFYNVISREQKKLNDKSSTRKLRTLWFCFMKIPVILDCENKDQKGAIK
jgi:hypothetical protein